MSCTCRRPAEERQGAGHHVEPAGDGDHRLGAAHRAVPVRPRRQHPFGGWGWAKARAGRAAAAAGAWRVHDIRRSVATHLAEQGIAPPHIIEAVLGHLRSGSQAASRAFTSGPPTRPSSGWRCRRGRTVLDTPVWRQNVVKLKTASVKNENSTQCKFYLTPKNPGRRTKGIVTSVQSTSAQPRRTAPAHATTRRSCPDAGAKWPATPAFRWPPGAAAGGTTPKSKKL